MKHLLSFFLSMILTLGLGTANAHEPSLVQLQCAQSSELLRFSDSEELPVIKIRLCLNGSNVSVCIEFDCDLHWTDAILPGFGQILGHKGCVPTGNLTTTGGESSTFTGSEGMIQAFEAAKGVPKGTLKFIEILESPTFPGPDGRSYRVVAKNYPVLQGTNGRYLPFDLELIK